MRAVGSIGRGVRCAEKHGLESFTSVACSDHSQNLKLQRVRLGPVFRN